MKSILNAVQKQNIPIKPAIVISNKPSAKGLKIARKLGVQTEIVESKGFQGTRWEYDQKIIHVLSKYDITPKNSLICLAGFMRILSPEFIKKFKNRILNIHPAFQDMQIKDFILNPGVNVITFDTNEFTIMEYSLQGTDIGKRQKTTISFNVQSISITIQP